jgi:hypothetical protein
MADRKSDTRVTQDPAADQAGEVKATADMSGKELKDSLANQADRDLHPAGEPKRSADKSSAPGGEAYPEDPPVRTTRPDVPIVTSLATGAGAHVPPDPDKYTPEGRPRYD